jgi:hypothetical protein
MGLAGIVDLYKITLRLVVACELHYGEILKNGMATLSLIAYQISQFSPRD